MLLFCCGLVDLWTFGGILLFGSWLLDLDGPGGVRYTLLGGDRLGSEDLSEAVTWRWY